MNTNCHVFGAKSIVYLPPIKVRGDNPHYVARLAIIANDGSPLTIDVFTEAQDLAVTTAQDLSEFTMASLRVGE